LKHLGQKTVIDVRRSVTKANRYRIREINEIQYTLAYIVEHQPELARAIIREMEANRSRLDPHMQQLLNAIKEHTKQPEKETASKYRKATPRSA
jgi:hypothetical protein